MEANKNEAIKAREMAGKSIEHHDFVAAKQFILNAQKLCPDLEGVTQMLVVIDIHTIAHNKTRDNEIDWYAILQVDKTAGDKLIKKQYHKLALLLHPDKNRSPGAEAAFKLVGEASCVLLDKTKRTVHDRKTNATTRPPGYASSSFQRHESWRGRKQHSRYQMRPRWRPTFAQQHIWTECPTCNAQHQILYTHLGLGFTCLSCGHCFQPTGYNNQKCTCCGPKRNPENPFAPPAKKTRREQKDDSQSSTRQTDTSTSMENRDSKKSSSKPSVLPQHNAPQERDEGQSSTQENDATTRNRIPKGIRSKPCVPAQPKAPQQRDEEQSTAQENNATTRNRIPKEIRSKPCVPTQPKASQQGDEEQFSTSEIGAYNQYCEDVNQLHEATMEKVHEEWKSEKAFTQFQSDQPTIIDATNVSVQEDPHAAGEGETSVSNPVEKSPLRKCREGDVGDLKRNREVEKGVAKQQQKQATEKLMNEAEAQMAMVELLRNRVICAVEAAKEKAMAKQFGIRVNCHN